jgi:hypothetical protein
VKPEGKGPLQRPRHRSDNNITVDVNEIGYDKMSEIIWFGIGTSSGLLLAL